jgi:hypothetical protein
MGVSRSARPREGGDPVISSPPVDFRFRGNVRQLYRCANFKRVIARSERDEAIQLPAQASWIASLSLAMTRLLVFTVKNRTMS